MSYLCICQQAENSDRFKGYGAASPGGLMNLATVGWSAQVGDKPQRWGSKV